MSLYVNCTLSVYLGRVPRSGVTKLLDVHLLTFWLLLLLLSHDPAEGRTHFSPQRNFGGFPSPTLGTIMKTSATE